MVGHICHSLKQTENNFKVEELFEDDANYPEPEDVTYDKLNDFNEERKGTGTSQYKNKPTCVRVAAMTTFVQYKTEQHYLNAKLSFSQASTSWFSAC